jgi:hypothetical protein
LTGAIMAYVVFNTWRKSKLPYLYLTASLLFLSSFVGLISTILHNWQEFCYPGQYGTPLYNEKCPTLTGPDDKSFRRKIGFAASFTAALS